MMDPELAIPDWTLSINDGAITLGGWTNSSTGYAMGVLRALGEKYGFTMDQPLNSLTEEQRQILLYGSNVETLTVTYTNDHGSGTYQVPYEGIMNSLERRYKQTSSNGMKEYYESFMRQIPCTTCHGARLKKESLAVQSMERTYLKSVI